jgi:hypothetical protein
MDLGFLLNVQLQSFLTFGIKWKYVVSVRLFQLYLCGMNLSYPVVGGCIAGLETQ